MIGHSPDLQEHAALSSSGEVQRQEKKNIFQARSFAERLEEAIRRYQNRSIETAQMISMLIDMAKDFREKGKRGEALGLTEEELAFYDALETDGSARDLLGDEILRSIARELTRTVRKNATIDWSHRESARARLRLLVKSLLKKHGYPPSRQQEATDNVLAQAEKLGEFFVESDPEPERPFRTVPPEEVQPFENAVPIYDLKAAAGGFSAEQQVDPRRFEWAELPDYYRPRPGLFVAQVVGESMNRIVPNGGWALFRLNPQGSREGKVVLVQHREIQDTETGGHFTLKRYRSEKETAPDGTWRHTRIVLRPESDRDGYEPIVIEEADEAELHVIAELIGVLS